MEQLVDNALRALTVREEQVLRLRFGIGGRSHAVDDLRRRFGVTQPWVQQVQRRALRKLRAAAL